MADKSSRNRSATGVRAQDLRTRSGPDPGSAVPGPAPRAALDPIDRRILAALVRDARIANNALAAEVGIAPSTCLGRVRAMREAGVIRGYHADLDPDAIGVPLQAMIAVRLRAGARDRMRLFTERMQRRPEVRNIYFLAGADDFILHVAARDTDDLRSFVVENLNSDADVAGTQTSLIFEHLRGASPL